MVLRCEKALYDLGFQPLRRDNRERKAYYLLLAHFTVFPLDLFLLFPSSGSPESYRLVCVAFGNDKQQR